ncbi:type I-E CRISPR-associated protein Cas6/Cse3/CasE [Methanolobus bombayensis]|uniref:type I-E CRISPR-associated protein Cas6/Cse3/CasE n=1 Tax=Methanolobus bombayensis TaxID=38023 RepID=UPI001AE468E4|nr:type I-E CRISPR-associated protein Cas6/Cse3/CasE [Methanolobus bombayensis]MBP1910171.1 CRISPR system Cascade subunit CasE [Methanolobus bombayensis]
MYMSRARLLPAVVSNKTSWKNMGNSYNIHRLVWPIFSRGADDKRSFIYRQESDGKLPAFYFVSEREPEDESGLWDIDVKQYDPILKSGQNLSFSLRANPIVSKRDEKGKQHRHDVVMDEKFRIKNENKRNAVYPDISEIVQTKGVEWLQKKAEKNGFLIDSNKVRADSYRKHKFYKPSGKHHVSFNTIDFTGFLTVTEPELFKQVLFNGIGPAKGFGCGLLLVRPIR